MACRKYTLTNNSPFTQTYTYQECNNLMWNYDFTIEAGQTRTIWLINGTYAAPLTSVLSVSDDGVFPPANSPTPSVTSSITPTPTSSITPTPSVTPSVTPTNSVTPTETPTNTPTNSVTPTITPTQTSSNTPTPTITPSSTPSFNFKLGNINTGGVYVSGITVTTGTIVTKSGYSYPVNENELLFADYTQSVTDLDFDIDIKDPSASDYRVVITINGGVSQNLTPGPGDVNLPVNISGLSLGSTDVLFVELQDL